MNFTWLLRRENVVISENIWHRVKAQEILIFCKYILPFVGCVEWSLSLNNKGKNGILQNCVFITEFPLSLYLRRTKGLHYLAVKPSHFLPPPAPAPFPLPPPTFLSFPSSLYIPAIHLVYIYSWERLLSLPFVFPGSWYLPVLRK